MRLALAFCLIGSASEAQTLMTAEEFDTWSLGKTLDYSVNGEIWGSEAYGPGRTTIDADTGGPCLEGNWFSGADAICFFYVGRDGLYCWQFWRDGDHVFAEPLFAAPDDPPQLVTIAEEPLACPEVGV